MILLGMSINNTKDGMVLVRQIMLTQITPGIRILKHNNLFD